MASLRLWRLTVVFLELLLDEVFTDVIFLKFELGSVESHC